MKCITLKPTRVSQFKKTVWLSKRAAATKLVKRLMDIVISLFALIILSPLFLVIAVWIKLDSKGEVFFKQTRIGLEGCPYTMWKFRSMSVDAEEVKSSLASQNEMATGVLFKMKKDPRITRVGAFIRKTSIDELPQLINVLKGDMSLVGPRPPLPSEVAEYQRSDRQRLAVLPGITCLWQVSGRSDIPFEQQVALDIQYIERQSAIFDLVLMFKTIPAVIMAKGAY